MLSRRLFVSSQFLTTLAVMLATAVVCEHQLDLNHLLSSKSILIQCIVLSICSGMWLTARRFIQFPWFQQLAVVGNRATFDQAIAALAVTLVVGHVWVDGVRAVSDELGLMNFWPWHLYSNLSLMLVLLGFTVGALLCRRTTLRSSTRINDARWSATAVLIVFGMPWICAWVSSGSGTVRFSFHRVLGWEGWLAVWAVAALVSVHAWETRSQWILTSTTAMIGCIAVLIGLWLPGHVPAGSVAEVVAFDIAPAKAPGGTIATFLSFAVFLVWLLGQFLPRNAAIAKVKRSTGSVTNSESDLRDAIRRRVVTFLAAPAVGITFTVTIAHTLHDGQIWGAESGLAAGVLEIATPLVILVIVAVFDGIRNSDKGSVRAGSMIWCLAAVQGLVVVLFWRDEYVPLPRALLFALVTTACALMIYTLGWCLWKRSRKMRLTAQDAAQD